MIGITNPLMRLRILYAVAVRVNVYSTRSSPQCHVFSEDMGGFYQIEDFLDLFVDLQTVINQKEIESVKEFEIFTKSDYIEPIATKQWSWMAFLFTGLWALCQGLYKVFFAYIAIIVTVKIAVSSMINTLNISSDTLVVLSIILSLTIRCLFGIYGNSWKARKMGSRGYQSNGIIEAYSSKDAREKFKASLKEDTTKHNKETDHPEKDGLTANNKPGDQLLDKATNEREYENSLKDKAVHLGDFSVEIPEGDEPVDGYVNINHDTKYSIKLSNFGSRPCDAEVEVDGKMVGIWRIASGKSIVLERPVHDTGYFTFYRFDSTDAQKAGLVLDDNLGLISVLFKPEKTPVYVDSGIKFSVKRVPGGTGLSGKSEQKFKDVEVLDYDEAGFVQIHLRLGCEVDEPRPLTPTSTPVPQPIRG